MSNEKPPRELCYTYNRQPAGCSEGFDCPHNRAHLCEFCLERRRTIKCLTHPGWQPRVPT